MGYYKFKIPPSWEVVEIYTPASLEGWEIEFWPICKWFIVPGDT